jgi:predicted DNA-binding transcriptional regulator YafY
VEDAVDVDAVVPSGPAGAPASATVDAAPDVAWQVARVARGEGVSLDDGWTRFTVPVGDPDAFVAWALGWGPDLAVAEPADLAERVASALRRAAARA